MLQGKASAFLSHIRDGLNTTQKVVDEVVQGIDEILDIFLDFVEVIMCIIILMSFLMNYVLYLCSSQIYFYFIFSVSRKSLLKELLKCLALMKWSRN